MPEVTEIRSARPEVPPVRSTALVVDLDGTLLKTDLLLESFLALIKQQPGCLLRLPVWLMKGRAYLKHQIASRISLDFSSLPYREEVVECLQTERAEGRTIVLASASDRKLVQQVADHLKLFDMVLASDGTTNLSAESKRARLVSEFGEKGFDYVGNDRNDLTVWASARAAMVVNPSRALRSRVTKLVKIERVFEDGRKRFLDRFKPLRPQHWLKNLLVFVPLLAAHRFDDAALTAKTLVAFLAFGCFASAGYLINDLLDLPADRRHPRKRLRPFASGDFPISYALCAIPALAGIGGLVGAMISPLFLGVVLIYFVLTMTYSLYLKKLVVLDVIVLAGLYSMRLMAGAAAVAIWPSHWLLAFSTFLFFSLALVKRYGELVVMRKVEGAGAKARGYEAGDGELLAAMGIASGYAAVLVLALYIESASAQTLYGRYELMRFLCPLLLYWISYVWLIAHRGRMPDDPLVFATSDRVSHVVFVLMLLTTMLAL